MGVIKTGLQSALSSGKLSQILSAASDITKPQDEPKAETKGLFGKNDEIEALEAQVAAKDAAAAKQKQTIMMVVIGAAVLLLFGKKLMK